MSMDVVDVFRRGGGHRAEVAEANPLMEQPIQSQRPFALGLTAHRAERRRVARTRLAASVFAATRRAVAALIRNCAVFSHHTSMRSRFRTRYVVRQNRRRRAPSTMSPGRIASVRRGP